MSIATVAAVGTATEGLSEALSASAASIGGAVSAVAWPLAIVAGAVVTAELFNKVWNKNRSKIPELNKTLIDAGNKALDLQNNVLIPATDNANAFLTNAENINKMNLIKGVLKVDIQKDIQNITTKLNEFKNAVFAQEQEWLITLTIWHVASTDNSFYTLNKNEVDQLINAYVSSKVDTDPLVKTGTEAATALKSLINAVDDQYQRAAFIVSVVLAPPTYNPLPNETERIRREAAGVVVAPVTVESLTTSPTLLGLAEYLLSKSKTITRTRVKRKWAKKLRRKKRKKKKKRSNNRPPQLVRTMWINTMNSSNWIKKVEFTFPAREKIDSDRKGTLKFYLKKGGVIKKVRVRRGTFSVIAVWSIGTKLGVGYRYWSQFNKAKIVNKEVFSYSLKRINAQDREIAIPIEILEKKVKYR